MKSILLTGANGYIGRHVAAELICNGADVIAVDRYNDVADGDCRRIACDVFESSESFIEKIGFVPDACLHLAWRDGFNHNAPSHMEDLPRHFDFLVGLARAGVSQIAVMGSMHEVGYWEGAITENTPCNPQSLYGIAKNALRQALAVSFAGSLVQLQWIRGFYIFGDDSKSQSIFGKLIRAAEAGQRKFPFTTGKNRYDFISVQELAAQIADVVMQNQVDGIINCCSGNPLSLAEMVERFIKEHDLDIELEYGAYPDRPYDSPGVWGDDSKIRSIRESAQAGLYAGAK